MGLTYAASGVDIDAGNRFAQMIRERVSAAWPRAGQEIGRFAGQFPVPDLSQRLCYASTDGVGTKAIVAALVDQFDGIGQDAVAMSAVDLYCGGGQPTAITDTLKVGKLDPDRHIAIIDSVIRGCKLVGCKLVGGETAELPDLFRHEWMVDLDTTAVGFHRPGAQTWDVKEGCKLYGWPSHGIGCNGFSLVRKAFGLTVSRTKARRLLDRRWPEFGNHRLADVLLEPTPIWINGIEQLERRGIRFAGHAHITGGGFPDNVSRIMPPHLQAVIDRASWVRPRIFRVIQECGHVGSKEMDRTFNNGIMLVSVGMPDDQVPPCAAVQIGEVRKRRSGEPAVLLAREYCDG